MNPSSSSASNKNSSPAARSARNAKVLGAVAGAIVGGAIGVAVVKRVRAGGAKSLLPAKAPVMARRALSTVKGVAAGAAAVAKVAASEAADQALTHMKTVAQEFVVDMASRGATAAAPTPAERTDAPTKALRAARRSAAGAQPKRPARKAASK